MADYRKIRRSQYIYPFGVGALYDLSDESFIAVDISKWDSNYGEKLSLNRLEHRLRVEHFKMPESYNSMGGKKKSWQLKKLPYERFPKWLFCRSCGTMVQWTRSKEVNGETPKCDAPDCKINPNLTPMRYVMACNKGHVADVDWHYWAHSYPKKDCKVKDKLKYKSREKKGGPALPTVICEHCNASRNLMHITSKMAGLAALGIRCKGLQPWESSWNSEVKCDGEVSAVQRSASNLYYPKLISALDIPLGKEEKLENEELDHAIKAHSDYSRILTKLQSSEGTATEAIIKLRADEIADTIHCSPEYVLALAQSESAVHGEEKITEQVAINEQDILFEEWQVLVSPSSNSSKYFSSHEEFLVGNKFRLDELLEKLILIPKLREVTALRGFHRITPSQEDFIPVDLGKKINWLPATEVFGEGIFISLKEESITSWIKKHETAITERLLVMQNKYNHLHLDFLPEPTPKFVLLHTLAHLLIRQLAFECGYAASSLRERIYASDEGTTMSGILIYTADSDSEGSLGGLVRQGNKDRFIPTLITALERGQWCSADPVCKELPGQGMNGLNRAACHSCTLLAETSCISHNSLLDRMLLLGEDEKNHNYGFFSEMIKRYRMELL
ncbi:MAG: DUF1998 domain-containing protein [Flammeovirgaceae bacterium]|nr:DUF1998 domain-containing protein [Flammeovirgaceae bacterium]